MQGGLLTNFSIGHHKDFSMGGTKVMKFLFFFSKPSKRPFLLKMQQKNYKFEIPGRPTPPFRCPRAQLRTCSVHTFLSAICTRFHFNPTIKWLIKMLKNSAKCWFQRLMMEGQTSHFRNSKISDKIRVKIKKQTWRKIYHLSVFYYLAMAIFTSHDFRANMTPR